MTDRGFTVSNSPPGLAASLRNFAAAAAAHVSAGRPKASDEDVAARWSTCESNECGYFERDASSRGSCSHTSCGCTLADIAGEAGVLFNKLRWADQACPLGLWAAVSPADETETTTNVA